MFHIHENARAKAECDHELLPLINLYADTKVAQSSLKKAVNFLYVF